jgi:hypothetical protein
LIFPDGTSPALLSCLIAGIPLKDVHALNFEPGEVRLDVNMNNSIELLKEQLVSPKYNEMLSVGKTQLEKLRKEELLKENEYQTPVVASQPTTTTYKQSEWQKNRSSRDQPDFFSVGALGAIGYMSTWRANGQDDLEKDAEKVVASTSPTLAFANATGSSSLFEPTSFSSFTMPETLSPTSRTVAPILATSIAEGGFGEQLNPNVFEDVPVLSKEERIEAANQAMEDYLSKDDGGDDWLDSMHDIMMNDE